jgi:hypothetical protein
MDFEQGLVHELQAIPSLAGKVYPQHAKENVQPPFVVYISSEGELIMTLSGPTEITELLCEIHIVAESYAQMKSITKSVIEIFHSFFQRSIGIDGPKIKSLGFFEPIEDIEENENYYKCSFDTRIRF